MTGWSTEEWPERKTKINKYHNTATQMKRGFLAALMVRRLTGGMEWMAF